MGQSSEFVTILGARKGEEYGNSAQSGGYGDGGTWKVLR